jgi:hypothetical protein
MENLAQRNIFLNIDEHPARRTISSLYINSGGRSTQLSYLNKSINTSGGKKYQIFIL